MSRLKEINIKNISLILCCLIVSAYIILGNCLTFNLGNRMPIKMAEIIAFLGCVILYMFHKKDILKITKGNIKLLIWFAIAAIPIIILNYELNQRVYGLLYSIRIIATIYVALAVINVLKKYEIPKEEILKYIIGNYILVVIIGIIQLIIFPDAFEFYAIFKNIGVYIQNPDPHIGRLVSTYFDPNFLAACLIIPMILSLNFWINTEKKRYLVYVSIFITAIVLTVSRSGVLGVCIALFLYTICTIKFNNRKLDISKKTKNAFIVMMIVGLVFVFMTFFTNIRVFKRIINTANDQSTYARLEDWVKGIKLFGANAKQNTNRDENIQTQPEVEPEVQPETQPEQQPEVQPEVQPETQPEQQPEVQPETQPEQQPEVQPETQNNNKSKLSAIFGIGYNMLGFTEANLNKPSSASFGNDSSILVIFISSGIIGSIYMIYLIGDWLIKTYKSKEKFENNVALITIILSSLIICNFNNLLFYTLWILPTFILLNLENKN